MSVRRATPRCGGAAWTGAPAAAQVAGPPDTDPAAILVLAQRATASLARLAPAARTVEITADAGLPRITIDRGSDHAGPLDATTIAPAGDATPVIAAAAAPLVPDGRLWRIDRLTRPDTYWADAAALPLLRRRFDDRARSWLYVDPVSREMVERQDRGRRLYRWSYTLLHIWDWPWLVARPALRRLAIWLMSAFGLMISISGVWIGYRRLVRRR